MKNTRKNKVLRNVAVIICTVAILVMVMPTALAADYTSLKLGSSGSDVTLLQSKLLDLGYLNTGKTTGYFGPLTQAAVISFQSKNGLTADGIAGNQTMNLLMSGNAKSAGEVSGIEKLIAVAESKLGCKYVSGGKGPDVFDCSGFVYWCLNHAGVSQAYMTSAAWQKCTKYQKINSMNALQRGDVISFSGHVGIYMGNGEMINAGSSQNGVVIAKNIQSSSYWTSHFICGFRIF